MTRDDFTKRTARLAAERVAYLCSKPDCRIRTIGAKSGGSGRASIGEAAHIRAAAKGGARYDRLQSTEDRKSLSNAIWLCGNHANLIDSDSESYPVELLETWKSEAEARARLEIGSSGGRSMGDSDSAAGSGENAIADGSGQAISGGSGNIQSGRDTTVEQHFHLGDGNQRTTVSVEDRFPQLYLFADRLSALMSRLRAHDMSDAMAEDYSSVRRGIEKVLSSLPNPRSYQRLFTNGRTIISDRSIALELSLAFGDPEWVYDAYRADSAIQFVIDRLESEAPNGLAHWLYRPGGPVFRLYPSTHLVEEQQ